MPKDLYDKLCGYYEFMLGPLSWRDEFERALRDTVSEEELELFFRIPFSGSIPHAKLAQKVQLPPPQLQDLLDRLASEGMIMAYTKGGQPVYERGNPVFMTEQQVRKPEDTPRRHFYARFFNSILNAEVQVAAPTRTPYYRVLPVEATLTREQTERAGRVVSVGVDVPDPRAVLPIDIVSEMIRRDARIIGVADCYCRRTKRLLGEGCHHPLQTCLVFNKVAETLIEHGTARRIDLDEALEIVRKAEVQGLVHNVDNCEGEIGSVCNCCPCCSILLTSWQRGMTNADSPSRYRVAFAAQQCQLCQACVQVCPTRARAPRDGRMVIDDARCLGCGLCVSTCPQGANRMVLREVQAKLPATAEALYGKIGREALVGIAKQRVLGLLRRA